MLATLPVAQRYNKIQLAIGTKTDLARERGRKGDAGAATAELDGQRARLEQERVGEEDRAFAVRLQNRLSGRLSLDLNLGITGFKHQPEAGGLFPVAHLLFGYRKN